MKKLVYSIIVLPIITSSCSTIKPYERQYISDAEMQMNSDPGKGFNTYVHSVREGATPAENTKASGGCGCN